MTTTRLGNYRLDLSVGASTQVITLLRVRSQPIIKIPNLGVYNTHGTQTLTWVLGINRGGRLHRYFRKATQAAYTVERADLCLYLTNEDDLALRIVGSGAATTFEVAFQVLDEN